MSWRTLRATDLRGIAPGVLLASVVLVAWPSAPARGDVVYLKNGGALEGESREGPRPGTVEIRRGDGTVVVLEEEQILRIEKSQTERARLEEQLEKAPPGELDPLEELLAEARTARLNALARAVAGKILLVDPHHAEARAQLGYVVFENRWVKREDLRRREGLVRVGGEWVRPEEKARREREETRRQPAADLEALSSGNEYVRDVAFSRIRRLLGRDEPWLREVAGEQLSHESPEVRKVALAVLARFPLGRAGAAENASAAQLITRLHRLALEEDDAGVRNVLRITLARFSPADSFRRALDEVLESPSAATRRRAAEIVYDSLQKAFMPRLCRAVASADRSVERPEVRDVLKRVFRSFGVDFGFDADRWLAYWREHEHEFYDDDGSSSSSRKRARARR